MKKILVLFLAGLMLLCYGAIALGAVHPVSKYEVDTWYTIDPDSPFFQALFARDDFSVSEYHIMGNYYLNDQTFINGVYVDISEVDLAIHMLSGSYLFDSGFFVGLWYEAYEEAGLEENTTVISPGFRWGLNNEQSYIAFSLDYLITDTPVEDESQLDAADLDLRYYNDTMRFAAEIEASEDDYTTGEFSAAFKASDQLTYGAYLYLVGGSGDGSMGLTYTTDWLIFDAQIGKNFAASPFYLDLGFMFQVANGFYLGFDATRAWDDWDEEYQNEYAFKLRSSNDSSNLFFIYYFETEADGAAAEVVYQLEL